MFGLPDDLNGWVVHDIGEEVRAGKLFQSDQEYAGLLEGVRCTFKPVAPKWYRPFLGYARWFYRGDEFPVLQCFWPDKQQHYPWESKFKAEWAWAQPLLWHTEPVLARAVELLASMEDKE